MSKRGGGSDWPLLGSPREDRGTHGAGRRDRDDRMRARDGFASTETAVNCYQTQGNRVAVLERMDSVRQFGLRRKALAYSGIESLSAGPMPHQQASPMRQSSPHLGKANAGAASHGAVASPCDQTIASESQLAAHLTDVLHHCRAARPSLEGRSCHLAARAAVLGNIFIVINAFSSGTGQSWIANLLRCTMSWALGRCLPCSMRRLSTRATGDCRKCTPWYSITSNAHAQSPRCLSLCLAVTGQHNWKLKKQSPHASYHLYQDGVIRV